MHSTTRDWGIAQARTVPRPLQVTALRSPPPRDGRLCSLVGTGCAAPSATAPWCALGCGWAGGSEAAGGDVAAGGGGA
ncbi:hypothetical protein, partial [Streptomyces sp. NPDC002088]|uniref:hypothetical protein n=1 Tax=Streptomyces sp. NPDC002088 TaxID=3154665 RepID=UPI00331B1F92